MALKTKIRATQVSASMPADTAAAAAASGLTVSHLSGTLAHMASAIRRIHGASSFTNSAAGIFGHTLKSDTTNTDALGTSDVTWSDLFLGDGAVINLGEDQDVTLTHVADAGVLLNSSRQLQFGDSATHIKQVSDSNLEIEADGSVIVDSPVLDLQDDGVILKMGDDSDVTLTHVHNSGVRLNSTMKLEVGDGGTFVHQPADARLLAGSDGTIELDAATTVKIDSDSGDISFEDGGTAQLALDMDGTGGEIIMQLKVASDDFVFKTQGGTEVFRVEDGGAFDIAGGLGASGVTVTAAGALSADGRIVTDDGTDATSTTDGSLQTDGGLSVAKDAVVGNDLIMLSDSSVVHFGAGKDVTLTHTNDVGLHLNAGMRLGFRDQGGEYIYSVADGTLGLVGASEIDLTATTIDINGAADISGNLTVGGNLDINGTTTTVDTVNMSVKDSIIALGVSGSDGGYSATGDRGILFPRGTDDSEVAGLYWDGNRFNMTVSKTGPLSGSFGAASGWNKLRLGRVEFESGNDRIHLDTDLKIKAVQNINLQAGGGAMTPVSSDGVALGTSSLMFSDLFLASGAVVNFNNGDVTLTHSANLLDIDGGPTRVDKLEIDSANDYIDVDTDLKIIAAADVFIDPNGGELKVDGNVVPNSDSADSLGASGLQWAKLWVDDIALAGQGRVDLDADNDTSIRAPVDDVIMFEVGGTDRVQISTTALSPDTDNGMALGRTTQRWSDLFLAEGGVINWDNGDATLTQANNVVTLAGATLTAQLTNSVNNVANGGILMTAYDGSAAVADLALDLDGMTDIGADLADADLIAIDDGAAGTNRKCAMSRVVTYIQAQLVQKGTSEVTVAVAADTDVNTTLGSDWTDAAIAQRECYVNGQLMLEGANASANKDFYAGGSAGRVKFEFGLEPGDVVQFILRAG